MSEAERAVFHACLFFGFCLLTTFVLAMTAPVPFFAIPLFGAVIPVRSFWRNSSWDDSPIRQRRLNP